jgi:26S proteasome regulatory subunit N7
MGSDPQYAKWPLLHLSQHVFTITNAYASKTAQQAAVKALQDAITEDKMAPFYRYLAHPIDGILNAVGEGGASGPGKPLSRKSSLVGMVATKASTTSVTLPWDEALYAKLKEDNDKELAEFQKEEDEAKEQAGDTEVMAAKGKGADFWARVGDKVWNKPINGCRDTRAALTAGYRTRRSPRSRMFSKRRVSLAPRSTWFSP